MLKAKFTRFAAVGTGVAMTLGMAMPLGAQTVADLQAQIAVLMAQLASLSGGSAASVTFTQNLTVGSRGAEVVALQQMLVAQGHLVMPAGVAYGYFGVLTKAAVARWQAANGVAPALGYWGPISRAKANAMGGGSTTGGSTTGGGTTGGLQGGEGSLEDFNELGDVEADLDEGDTDEKVLGIEFDAEDSDLSVNRVDVEFTLAGGSGSTQLDNYIDEVSLIMDGKVLASMDVDEASEDDDVFTFRFSGLNGVVREDNTAELYVAVDAVDNIDSGDTHTVTATIPVDGIRAVDAAGISDTYDGTAYSEDFTIGEATGGDLDITEGDDNPESMTVLVDEDDDTDGVLVLAFDLDADNMDVNIDAIPVGLVTTENDGVDGPVSRVILKMDGQTIDTVAVPASAGTSYQALFSDLDIDLSEGDTAEFTVYVDLNDADVSTFATGTTLYATTTGSDSQWDVEDDAGDSVTPSGSVSNSGDTLSFQTEGVQVTLVSTDEEKSFTADAAGEKDEGTFTIVFDVTALDEDIYLDRSVTRDDTTAGGTAGDGFMWATTTDSTTGTSTAIAASISVADASAEYSTGLFKINAGQTERFTLQVVHRADTNGYEAVKLTAINWTTNSADTTPDNFHTSGLTDFKTGNLVLSVK